MYCRFGRDSLENDIQTYSITMGKRGIVGQNVPKTPLFPPFSNDFPVFRPKIMQKDQFQHTQNAETPVNADILKTWSQKTRL